MNGEISHGLPELVTSSNQILRADTMQPVLLRGVNRSGLEYAQPSDAGFLGAAQSAADEMREMILNWRSNIIRLPFNQDWRCGGGAATPGARRQGALAGHSICASSEPARDATSGVVQVN